MALSLKKTGVPDEVTLNTGDTEYRVPMQQGAKAVQAHSITVALEGRARDFERQSDHVGNALLLDIAVAAGALKQKTQAAKGHFTGETAALIDHLHEIL